MNSSKGKYLAKEVSLTEEPLTNSFKNMVPCGILKINRFIDV